MINNASNYENNQVFNPKSADDLNKQERQSDVLISTIEKCERLEKQLKIAIDKLELISTHICFLGDDTKEQVSIVYTWSTEALKQIKELNK